MVLRDHLPRILIGCSWGLTYQEGEVHYGFETHPGFSCECDLLAADSLFPAGSPSSCT